MRYGLWLSGESATLMDQKYITDPLTLIHPAYTTYGLHIEPAHQDIPCTDVVRMMDITGFNIIYIFFNFIKSSFRVSLVLPDEVQLLLYIQW